ncbi:MAG: glycosyltransferase, partial [Bacteroidaceae bacterium]|nr:glycosyltransferase [Bacteroidaceae bacterium]
MKLSVVIVNYNVRYYLEQCLLSVEKALCGLNGEVFVVDNASTDDSMTYLKSRFPWVRYIEN